MRPWLVLFGCLSLRASGFLLPRARRSPADQRCPREAAAGRLCAGLSAGTRRLFRPFPSRWEKLSHLYTSHGSFLPSRLAYIATRPLAAATLPRAPQPSEAPCPAPPTPGSASSPLPAMAQGAVARQDVSSLVSPPGATRRACPCSHTTTAPERQGCGTATWRTIIKIPLKGHPPSPSVILPNYFNYE